MTRIFCLWLLSLTSMSIMAQETPMKGITMVAPPREFQNDPIPDIVKVNAEWIGLVPFGFTRIGQTEVYFNSDRQWWGEKPEGVKKCVQLAHNQGLKVMIKPQVYIPRGWIGDMDFDTDEEWLSWEASYRVYIMEFAQVASAENAEMLCIGTEIRESAKKRPQFWRTLIKDIRKIYKGKLTYSANWDSYEEIPFWNDLDFIGISAYFPLTERKTPTLQSLKKEWRPIVKKLKKFSKKWDKKILFTEYGYLAVDRCAYQTWELEKQVKSLPINETAQANAYQALLETFKKESFWAGGFLWKWFPNMQGHEGYVERDYTPQGKIAEKVITKMYSN